MTSEFKRLTPALEVVKIVDLETIASRGNTPSFHFRVEILREIKDRGRYRARVYRRETFRIQPSFPQKAGRPIYHRSDEFFFVEDFARDWESLTGKTEKEILNRVLRELRRIFAPSSP